MAEQYRVEPREPLIPGARPISWGAIFAGAVVALVLHLMLGVLGLGIGIGAVSPGSVGMAFGIWFLLSSILALFLGGWVAARLSGVPRSHEGMLHGFVTWSFTTLVYSLVVMTAFGSLFAGTAGFLGRQMAQAGLGEAARIAQAPDPAKEAAIQTMMEQENVSREQAERRVNQIWEETREGATTVAGGVSQAAWWTFLAMLVGAISAIIGGWLGRPRYRAPVAAV